MSDLMLAVARALESDDGRRVLDLLAERIASRIAEHEGRDSHGGWLTTAGAAEYLGISVPALHRLTSERRVTFSQEARGGKCWFRRADLDAFRDAGLQPATDHRAAASVGMSIRP